MKKIFLTFICLLVFVASLFAQTIKPAQLKNARMAVHQWVRDYNIYAQMAEKRNPTKKFINLFESDDILIMNDYLPSIHDKGSLISVKDYAKLVANKSSFYKMQYEIKDATIVSEKMLNRSTLEFVVEFDKVVEFFQRDSYAKESFAYPEKTYKANVTIRYDLRKEEAVAVMYESDDNFESIVILHNPSATEVNKYTSVGKLNNQIESYTTPLIKWSYESYGHDPQMFYYTQDTIKRNIHFGLDGGISFVAAKFEPALFNLSNDLGATSGINIGMYHQMSYNNNKRWGFEYDIHVYYAGLGIIGNYMDRYEAIDPDGGIYERIIKLDNYQERISRYAAEIPVALRYDYMLRKDLSFYTRFGVDVSVDLYQTSKVSAQANYSGYYDWLFGVTIDQNGIYDFGQFDLSATTKTTAINRLSIGAFVGAGIQYFIPKSRWSLQCGLQYGCKFYNGLLKQKEVHLSNDINDWQSATALYQYFIGQRISAQFQFNYNF